MGLHYSQRERNEQLAKAKESIKWFGTPPSKSKTPIPHTKHHKKGNKSKKACIAGLSKNPQNPNTARAAQQSYEQKEIQNLIRLAKLLREHPEKVKLSGYV